MDRPQENISTYLARKGRNVPWKQGEDNQKYTRNVQSDVLQDPKDKSSKGGEGGQPAQDTY